MKKRMIFVSLLVCGALLVFPAHAFAQVPDPGNWVDDLSQDIEFLIEGRWYDLLRLHAEIQWYLMKIFVITGIVIDLVTDFLAERAFAPLITQSSSQFGVAVSMSFTIAMLVLGMSYMIAHFIRLNVVELRSALMWYALVGLFFQLGPEMYLGMNSLRADINSFFYATSMQSVNASSPLAPLNQHLAQTDVPLLPPCDNFGWMTHQNSTHAGAGVDGLDIALAYMLATSRDVLGEPSPTAGNCRTFNPGGYESNLPFHWYHSNGYFDTTISPATWEYIPPEEQQRALDQASAAQYRLFGAWSLLWLGLFEKIVYLLVTFAQGLSFISFSVAAIFAFFKRTEAIARSVVDLWIEIIISSVVIALGQSLIVALALAAAATQNPLATIGVGLLCAVVMFILMVAGMRLVWNALTRIFSAISQSTMGVFIPPQQLATGASIGAVGTVAAVATGGGALALAGAAMTGLGAAGIGGSASSMAGSQLMIAGRMAARHSTVQSSLLSGAQGIASSQPATSSSTPPASMTHAPVVIAGYEMADLQPNSSTGRRTAHIQGRFTMMEEAAAQPITQAQSRQIIEADNYRDESTAQARLNADNTRDDVVLRDTLRTQSAPVDASILERAGRDLQAAAGALKASADQQHQDRVMGRLSVSGQRNVGAVVADAVDMEREYRQKMQKPLLDGAGEQFAGRMVQAVGMEPFSGHAPVSDAARFNAMGDQALRLGLNGGQVVQVLKEQSQAADGRSISPETQARLIQHIRAATDVGQSVAQQQATQFLTVTAALPDQVHLTGSIVPSRVTQEGNPHD